MLLFRFLEWSESVDFPMMHLGIGLQHAWCPQSYLLVTVRYRIGKESRQRMLETRGRGEQKKGSE